MDEEDPLIQFAEIASEEEEWFFMAEDLRLAAEALEPQIKEYWMIEKERESLRDEEGSLRVFMYNPDPTGIYFMLTAYAIENLCKGLLVRKSKDQVWDLAAKKGSVPKELLSHDLLTLLNNVNFPLRPEDEELAFRLKRSAVWSARYPVPTKASHPTVKLKLPSGEEVVPRWHQESDLQSVKELFSRVDSFVSEQLKIRPDGHLL
ncbi:MAG: hypothetical protein ACJ76Y_30610 [Thermoanaerobaculia bacterium]